MSSDFDEWVNKVQQWNDMTKHIPAMVREDIVKSKLDFAEPKRGVKSTLYDPFSIQYALGYKDRSYSLSYDILKRTARQLSIISAIINTRCSQVAAFSSPHRITKSVGYRISHKDVAKLTTKGERQRIKELEDFIARCGAKDPNPHNIYHRDSFEDFLRKIVRDSLVLDQACAEVVPDRRGIPYEFLAVDASTIRIAAKDMPFGPDETYKYRPSVVDNSRYETDMKHPFKTMQLYAQDPKERPDYVQVINGQIENTFTRDELIFGVRNPRSDIYVQGYGYSEIESLITIITAHLNAEEYNKKIFSNGAAPKGLLNFKGDNFTPEQLEGFKREWKANMEGVQNSHRTVILQNELGIEWTPLTPTNQEMEYGKWLEYCIKIISAVFMIDPEELHFSLSGGVSQTPLFESSNEWKLKASRDKGLKPLLRFIAKLINDHIIAKIDDNYTFDFIGLDELTEQEKQEMRKEQVTTYMTLNEIRKREDLPEVKDGDIVLNPTYLQGQQLRTQAEQQDKQMQQDQGTQLAEGPSKPGSQEKPEESGVPQYADAVTKSASKYIEIDLDEWKADIRAGA